MKFHNGIDGWHRAGAFGRVVVAGASTMLFGVDLYPPYFSISIRIGFVYSFSLNDGFVTPLGGVFGYPIAKGILSASSCDFVFLLVYTISKISFAVGKIQGVATNSGG